MVRKMMTFPVITSPQAPHAICRGKIRTPESIFFFCTVFPIDFWMCTICIPFFKTAQDSYAGCVSWCPPTFPFDEGGENLRCLCEPAQLEAQRTIPRCQLLRSRPAPCMRCWPVQCDHWGVWRWRSGWGSARRRSGQTAASIPCNIRTSGTVRLKS